MNAQTESREDPLDGIFGPIIGLPAWGVEKGHSSFLTFEFGDPWLSSYEWMARDGTFNRRVDARGTWHLWIYCCHWRVRQRDADIWSEDEPSLIANAASRMDGQKLLSIEIDPQRGRSTFLFDLGATLETWPYSGTGTDEQWKLMTRDTTASFRADGCYRFGPNTTPCGSEPWTPLYAVDSLH